MSFLEEGIAVVTCLNSVVVAGARSELNFPLGAFDIQSKTNTIESLRLDSFIILVIAKRSWCHQRLLLLLLPKSELFRLALRKCWPPPLSIIDIRVVLICVAFFGRVVIDSDSTLDVASSSVLVVRMAKEAGFLKVHSFKFGVSLDIVVVWTWIVLP